MRKHLRKILFWSNILFATALFGSYAANHISPEYFWFFSFFGLAYPILLLINTGFIIFWALRKKWYFLLSLGVILLGWPNVGKIIRIRFSRERQQAEERIKILTYNVRLFNYYETADSRNERDNFLRFIEQQEAEIVCIQELFTVTNIPEHSESRIDSFLTDLPHKHVFYSTKATEYANYGLATYSKYPVIKKGNIRFRNSFNSCIYTDVVIESDTVRIFNVHLQSVKLGKDHTLLAADFPFRIDLRQVNEFRDISGRLKLAYIKRAQQVDELNWHIGHSPYRVVVCGDFNDTPVSYSYKRLKGKLADAFISSGSGTGSTYRAIYPLFRIDFIFHSKTIRSFNYQTHRIKLSDHYPISCELSFDR